MSPQVALDVVGIVGSVFVKSKIPKTKKLDQNHRVLLGVVDFGAVFRRSFEAMLAKCLPCAKKDGFTPLEEDGAPAKAAGPPSSSIQYTVNVTNSKGKSTCTVNVTHETGGQHTLVWSNPVIVETGGRTLTLPPGNMNCYGFPIAWVEGMDKNKTKPLEGDEYKCICEVRLSLPCGGGSLADNLVSTFPHP